jgi:hypothetical protein
MKPENEENKVDSTVDLPTVHRNTPQLLAFQAEHGTRAASTKHGIHTWREFGVLPASAAHLTGILAGLEDEMIADLGGEDNLTGGQKALIAAQRVTLGVILLASEHLSREGLHNKRNKLQPVIAVLGTFVNTLRLNADKLGLARVPRQVESLESIAAEYAERRGIVQNGQGDATQD